MKLGHWSLWCAVLLAMGSALAQNPLPPQPDQPGAGEAGAQSGQPPVPAFDDAFDRARLGNQAAGNASQFDEGGGRRPLPPAAGRRLPTPRQDGSEGRRRPAPPRQRAREPFRGPEQPGAEGEFDRVEPGPREGEFFPERERVPRRDGEFEADQLGPQLPTRGRRPMGERPQRGFQDEFDQLRQRDPQMAALIQQDMELERASMELAEQYRRAGPDRREEIRRELAELVAKHFEVRQQRRELEIVRLKEQLERLQASLKRRADNKETVINQRVAQLLGEDVIDF